MKSRHTPKWASWSPISKKVSGLWIGHLEAKIIAPKCDGFSILYFQLENDFTAVVDHLEGHVIRQNKRVNLRISDMSLEAVWDNEKEIYKVPSVQKSKKWANCCYKLSTSLWSLCMSDKVITYVKWKVLISSFQNILRFLSRMSRSEATPSLILFSGSGNLILKL